MAETTDETKEETKEESKQETNDETKEEITQFDFEKQYSMVEFYNLFDSQDVSAITDEQFRFDKMRREYMLSDDGKILVEELIDENTFTTSMVFLNVITWNQTSTTTTTTHTDGTKETTADLSKMEISSSPPKISISSITSNLINIKRVNRPSVKLLPFEPSNININDNENEISTKKECDDHAKIQIGPSTEEHGASILITADRDRQLMIDSSKDPKTNYSKGPPTMHISEQQPFKKRKL
eukprot:48347_1